MSNRKSYVFDKRKGKVVEMRYRTIEDSKSPYVIGDTMPLTKSPLSRTLYFDSKRALRKHYKQNGVEEIGNDYENGSVDRMVEQHKRDEEKRINNSIRQNLIERMFHGKR